MTKEDQALDCPHNWMIRSRKIHCVNCQAEGVLIARAEVDHLKAERDKLADWKESALAALAKSEVLHKALEGRVEYWGWDVHDAAADALKKAEAQGARVLELAWCASWRNHEHNSDVAGVGENMGHEGPHSACPHPDCQAVRSVEKEP